ncbi:hypothetical protein Tco_0554428, partial [Tanacetum coccineum]
MYKPNKEIYRNLEKRPVHERRAIDPSFYQDTTADTLAKFRAINFDCLLNLDEEICH